MAHILLVQRDTDMRKLLHMVLRLDYRMEEANESETALRTLRAHAGSLVVLLGDWPRAYSEKILRACENEPELQRHVYLLVSVNYEDFTPDFRGLLERLSVRVIRVPFELSELQAIVREASARADAAAGAEHGSVLAQE